MRCSNCNQEGHNRRTCPNLVESDEEPRDRAIILRVDGMTQKEQNEMHLELVKLKKRVTSDAAKATLVEGKSKELPSKIQALIDESKK